MRRAAAALALPKRASGVTITRWLYDEIRRAILECRLPRGAPLPATRTLSADYGVSRRIVVDVFDQLRAEGYLEARAGSGTCVRHSLPEDFAIPAVRVRSRAGIEDEPLYRRPVRPFRAIEPAIAEFPVDLWARLTARCTRSASTAHLAGGEAGGFPPLREAIAAYLGASRGVAASPHQVVITSGAQQGLDLLARTLLRPGDHVWMEDPGYTDAVETLRLAGATIVPVPVDAHGLVVERGLAACPRPAAVYVTPAHQFPLGVTMRADRRLQLLQWAHQNRVLIIEDDYDSEFRFSGRPIPALKGLAGGDSVCLVGTFNKCLFPALRIGYIVVPDYCLDALLRLRRLVDRHPAVLPQMVVAEFLDQGHFARHLRRMRQLYGSRLAALRAEVHRELDGALKLPPIEAGLTTPAFLVNGMTSRRAAELAARRSVEVWTLDRFALSRRDLRGLVLGFAAFDERAIRRGILELARALAWKT